VKPWWWWWWECCVTAQVRVRRVRRINITKGIRVKGEYSMGCLVAIIERQSRIGGAEYLEQATGIWGRLSSGEPPLSISHDAYTLTHQHRSTRLTTRQASLRHGSARVRAPPFTIAPSDAGPVPLISSTPPAAATIMGTAKGASTRMFHRMLIDGARWSESQRACYLVTMEGYLVCLTPRPHLARRSTSPLPSAASPFASWHCP
jgi:hypothetical protein